MNRFASLAPRSQNLGGGDFDNVRESELEDSQLKKELELFTPLPAKEVCTGSQECFRPSSLSKRRYEKVIIPDDPRNINPKQRKVVVFHPEKSSIVSQISKVQCVERPTNGPADELRKQTQHEVKESSEKIISYVRAVFDKIQEKPKKKKSHLIVLDPASEIRNHTEIVVKAGKKPCRDLWYAIQEILKTRIHKVIAPLIKALGAKSNYSKENKGLDVTEAGFTRLVASYKRVCNALSQIIPLLKPALYPLDIGYLRKSSRIYSLESVIAKEIDIHFSINKEMARGIANIICTIIYRDMHEFLKNTKIPMSKLDTISIEKEIPHMVHNVQSVFNNARFLSLGLINLVKQEIDRTLKDAIFKIFKTLEIRNGKDAIGIFIFFHEFVAQFFPGIKCHKMGFAIYRFRTHIIPRYMDMIIAEMKECFDGDLGEDALLNYRKIQFLQTTSEYQSANFEETLQDGLLKICNQVVSELGKIPDNEFLTKLNNVKAFIEKLYTNDSTFESRESVQKSLRLIAKEVWSYVITENYEPQIIKIMASITDKILRDKSIKKEDLDQNLSVVISLFEFLVDKEDFLVEYERGLHRRLIQDRAYYRSHEQRIIDMISKSCGPSKSKNMKSMIADITDSEALTREFKKLSTKQGTSSRIAYDFKILTESFWPKVKETPIILPPELAKIQTSFESFYKNKDKNARRNLTWVPNRHRCLIRSVFKTGTKEIFANMPQTAIILLFNNCSPLTGELSDPSQQYLSLEEIGTATGIPEPDLRKAIWSLVYSKYPILLRFKGDNGKVGVDEKKDKLSGKDALSMMDLFKVNLDLAERGSRYVLPPNGNIPIPESSQPVVQEEQQSAAAAQEEEDMMDMDVTNIGRAGVSTAESTTNNNNNSQSVENSNVQSATEDENASDNPNNNDNNDDSITASPTQTPLSFSSVQYRPMTPDNAIQMPIQACIIRILKLYDTLSLIDLHQMVGRNKIFRRWWLKEGKTKVEKLLLSNNDSNNNDNEDYDDDDDDDDKEISYVEASKKAGIDADSFRFPTEEYEVDYKKHFPACYPRLLSGMKRLPIGDGIVMKMMNDYEYKDDDRCIVNMRVFKKCLEGLVEQEYVIRDPTDNDKFTYVY